MSLEILFVHGMWSQPWVWENWKARFEQMSFPCSMVTLKGHGAGEDDRALERVGMADYRAQVRKRVNCSLGKNTHGWRGVPLEVV